MKFVTLRELKINPSKILNRLVGEDLVVTRNGKPAAAMVYLDDDLLDDFIVAHHPTFLKELHAARKEYKKKGGIDHETMKKRVKRRRG